MKMTILSSLLFLTASGYACEPPPTLSYFCKAEMPTKTVPESLVTKLSKSVIELDKKLVEFAISDTPSIAKRLGDGSCYMMTTADFYASDLHPVWKSSKGQLCTGLAKESISSVKVILNPKATAYQHIRNK
ncbi:MAG: hypothetical protein HRT45_11015 [Bdellovibrionales bacterium]|nr:hypothetical protein [Bdellovibrionales bacterium]